MILFEFRTKNHEWSVKIPVASFRPAAPFSILYTSNRLFFDVYQDWSGQKLKNFSFIIQINISGYWGYFRFLSINIGSHTQNVKASAAPKCLHSGHSYRFPKKKRFTFAPVGSKATGKSQRISKHLQKTFEIHRAQSNVELTL